MASSWTRRDFLVGSGAALAAAGALEHLHPCCAMAADAPTARGDLFELRPVADGIYAAIAAPRYKVNCNATVILTNDGVVVVDSHSKPSASAALYAEIRGITKQPVKRVVNTHFHWDHWQGNQTYKEIYPDLEIISSARTLDNLTRPDAGNGGIPNVEKQLAALPGEIEQLGNELASATDAAQRLRLEANLRQTRAYYEELQQFRPALPTRTFDETVSLVVGDREIRILLLGRGHTDGDVFIHLPREGVVATGDALIDWMPYMNDGFPEDWVRTLDALERHDFAHIIPGHGGVLPREHLAFFRGYLADLVEAVKSAHAQGASLEEMKRTLPDRLAVKYEQGMSKHPLGRYRDRIASNIEVAYAKVMGGA
ncbi:MAG TPA: MBL fold metallo-hydrolase [Burkholderiales bacterium]|nr:MBL fold metallo-hydrolase [Burkholderiales bacterium]